MEHWLRLFSSGDSLFLVLKLAKVFALSVAIYICGPCLTFLVKGNSTHAGTVVLVAAMILAILISVAYAEIFPSIIKSVMVGMVNHDTSFHDVTVHTPTTLARRHCVVGISSWIPLGLPISLHDARKINPINLGVHSLSQRYERVTGIVRNWNRLYLSTFPALSALLCGNCFRVSASTLVNFAWPSDFGKHFRLSCSTIAG
jgi:hypothetical protein